MPKLPKWPKGLKAKLARAKRKAEQQAKVDARKKEIEQARKDVAKYLSKIK